MKKRHFPILTLFLFLLNVSCIRQKKKYYHEFEPTASEFRITKWNIKQIDSVNYYVSEQIDSENRVIELKFYENGKNNFSHLCYLQTWVKYEYPNDTTIIQLNLNNKNVPEANIECESPSKITYHLSADQKLILRTEYEYDFDHSHYENIGWTEEFISKILSELKSQESSASLINFYSKSFEKLNGIFPVNNEFDIKTFYFSKLEKEKVKSGIK
jgi:hypothetical protein